MLVFFGIRRDPADMNRSWLPKDKIRNEGSADLVVRGRLALRPVCVAVGVYRSQCRRMVVPGFISGIRCHRWRLAPVQNSSDENSPQTVAIPKRLNVISPVIQKLKTAQ